MDIRCEKCGMRYVLDDQRVPASGATVRCTSCGNVFHVKKDAAAAPPPLRPASPPPQPPAAPPPGTPGPAAAYTPGPAAPFAGTPGPAASYEPTPGPSSYYASTPGPPPGHAATPGPTGAAWSAPTLASAPAGTPGPAAPIPPRPAAPAPRGADPLSAFEESFGVAPSRPEERAHTHPMVAGDVEPDLRVLRPGHLGRYATITVALLVGATAVVYLLFRSTFDEMLGIGVPEVPPAALAKLEQARAASRLDTLAGYQEAVKTAQEAIRAAGEVPFPDAWSRIALAYVGWADLMNQRARRHQATADAIVVSGAVPEASPPACCPIDPAARAGLDALCAPPTQGGRPCTELEEAARIAAIEARDEAIATGAEAKSAKERAEASAIRDRADARERLTQALNAARKARSLAPQSDLATVALAAHDRAGGQLEGFRKLVAPLKARKDAEPPVELLVEEALASERGEALALLQKAAAADPNDARVHWLTAERHEAAGQDAEATGAAERAVALSPEHEAARSLLRVLSLRARRGAAAVEATDTP